MAKHHSAVRQQGRMESNLAAANRKAQAETAGRISRQDWTVYGWVLGITAGLLLALFAARQIYPFGDNVLRYSDGDQYFSFLGYLQSTMYSANDVFYAWSTVLGGGIWDTLAYYSASPFNLLIALFPGNLMLGYHFIFVCKFLASALCFAVMLQKMFPEAGSKAVILFAVSYPFIGYMTYFAWNQSWMDGVLLLPLMVLGIRMILQRQSPVLYTTVLGLALLSNYYIGYMLCLAAVLLFLGGAVLVYQKADREVLKAVLWFAAATAAAVALAAVVLLPVWHALPEDRGQTLTELIEETGYQSRPEEVLSMLYTAPFVNMTFQNNYPVIYTGIVQLVLAVLFFLNPDIPARWKAVAAGILLVFMLSFMVSTLNRIWHGFTTNTWYNYRYSFIVSFLLELMAFCSFVRLPGAGGKLLSAALAAAVITVMALQTDMDNIGAGTLLFDMICICAALVLFHVYIDSKNSGKAGRSTLSFFLIGALVLGNIACSSYRSLEGLGDWDESRNGLGNLEGYTEAVDVNASIEQLMGTENGFYRRASTQRYGRNDPMLFGYAGVENYASTENPWALAAAGRMGLKQAWMWVQYDDNVPLAADALLGLRYIATGDVFKSAWYTESGQIASSEMVLYENPWALPPVFAAAERFEPDRDSLNDFTYLNGCWNSIVPAGGDIFQSLDFTREDVYTGDGTDIYIRFTAAENGPVYLYLPVGDRTVNTPIQAYDQDVYFAGICAAGQTGEVFVHAGETYDGADRIAMYTERIGVLADKAAAVQGEDLQIEMESSSRLNVHFAGETGGIIASTIPYDDGWQVTVDGEETETFRNMDAFLAFSISGGGHEITLTYRTPYLWAGAVISAAALAALLLFAFRRQLHLRERTVAFCSRLRRKAGQKKDSGKPA